MSSRDINITLISKVLVWLLVNAVVPIWDNIYLNKELLRWTVATYFDDIEK